MHAPDTRLAALAPVTRAFMQRHGIPPDSIRLDGRLTVTIDGRYAVDLLGAPYNRVALQSELAALSDRPDFRCDAALLRLGSAGAGLLRRHAGTLCIDQKRQALMVQRLLPASASVQALQDALADFANSLAMWTQLCRAEATALRGDKA